MRNINICLLSCLFCVLFISSDLSGQSYNDGPIQLQIKVREIQTGFSATDGVLGVGFNPDEPTYKVWARDNGNYDALGWQGGQCLTDNFDPPGPSNDFNRIIFNHSYSGATVPQFFDIRGDFWEDDSDDATCRGSRCNFESSFCCGAIVFGACVGFTQEDDVHCDANPFKQNMDYRLGPPCQWYNHGQVAGNCGNNYRPRIESYWRYTKGTACNDAIDLGNLPSGGSVSHFNSTECYSNSWAASGGQDVFYQFSVSSVTGVIISLCGASTNFNTTLYLLDNSCNQIAFNDNSCGNVSEITTNLCTPGTYKVVVDGATASSQGVFTLTITDDPSNIMTVDVVGTDVSCNGGSDGKATANVTGGTSPYIYTWDPNVGNTSTVTNLAPGQYTVTVNDGTGCTAIDSVTISEPTVLSFTTSVTPPTCNGGSDGSITVSASGGTPPYQYSSDGGNIFQNNNTLTGLAANTYTVVVKDSNDCTKSSTVTLTDPSAIQPNLTVSNISCNGANDGSVTSNPTNGTPPYQYSLDSGPFVTNNSFTGIASGFHTLTVKDSLGCQQSEGFNIFEPTALNSFISSSSDVSCNGGSDGSFTVTVSGGTTPYSFSIDGTNFQSSGTFTGLTANTYNVFVKDSNNCQTTNTVIIDEPTPLILSVLFQINISCTGATDGTVVLTASGGTGPYEFSPDQVFYYRSGFFDNLAGGTYTYYVRDNNSCEDSITFTIFEPTPLGLVATDTTDASCLGISDGSITVSGTGGTQPYRYSIDGGAFTNDSTFDNLDAGSYDFTVEDNNGCQFTQTFSIGFITTINATITSTNVGCNGDTTGSITISASGGASPYTYSLDGTNFQALNTFTGLAADNYTVTVKDDNGCLGIETVTITEPDELAVSVVSTTAASCFNTTDGSLEIDVTGGTSPYNFDWSNDSTTQNLINVGGGSYTVVVTDNNGCTATLTATVGQSPEMFIDLESGIKPVSCNGQSDGGVNVKVLGGTPPYSYVWTGGANTEDISNVVAGTYTLTVSDANGCSLQESYTVTQPSGLFIALVSSSDASCANGNGGAITVSTTGGVQPYSYSVDGITYQNDSVFTGLTAGNYSVEVKDDNGCTNSVAVTIEDGGDVFYSYGGDIEIINGQTVHLEPILSPDSLVIDSVSWEPQEGLSCTNCLDPMANPTETTVYTATIIDENGCETSTTVRIVVSDEFQIFIPNIFTPNNDGVNDRFSLHAYGTTEIGVRIFNRWGAEVYYNANQQPNTTEDGWDGMFNGEEAQAGTYLYMIDVTFTNNEERQKIGTVALVR